MSPSDVEVARSDCFKLRPIRLTTQSQTTKSKSSKSKSSGKSEVLLNPLLIKKQQFYHPYATQQSTFEKWQEFVQDTWHIIILGLLLVIEKALSFLCMLMCFLIAFVGNVFNQCKSRRQNVQKLQIVLDLDQTIIKTKQNEQNSFKVSHNDKITYYVKRPGLQ